MWRGKSRSADTAKCQRERSGATRRNLLAPEVNHWKLLPLFRYDFAHFTWNRRRKM